MLEQLQSGTWKSNAIHNVKVINDGIQQKKREIVCPDFVNEQIIHHAILNICAPIFKEDSINTHAPVFLAGALSTL